jgi:hypothetical protein
MSAKGEALNPGCPVVDVYVAMNNCMQISKRFHLANLMLSNFMAGWIGKMRLLQSVEGRIAASAFRRDRLEMRLRIEATSG